MKEVGELVLRVYAAGAGLVVLDGGLAVDGEIPDELREKVRAHREGLFEALVGDPLEGFGWEARTACTARRCDGSTARSRRWGPISPIGHGPS